MEEAYEAICLQIGYQRVHVVECVRVERCATTSYARGTEFLMGYYAILDRTPKGRDEGDQPMGWLRRHNEYHNQ